MGYIVNGVRYATSTAPESEVFIEASREWNYEMRYQCLYCGGYTKDDANGHCVACGAPKYENGITSSVYRQESFKAEWHDEDKEPSVDKQAITKIRNGFFKQIADNLKNHLTR